MSYGMAAALQQALFERLSGDTALLALVDGVYDALPSGIEPTLYVLLGDETAKDRSDVTGAGALHDFEIAVLSDQAGFHSAKLAAAAVSDALLAGGLTLSRGTLAGIWFLKARTKRETGGDARRITLKFRARVEEI